jgi:hypothetical protein
LPSRSRCTSLPSLTTRRPKVDSAMSDWRQNSEIWLRISSFFIGRVLGRRWAANCGWAVLITACPPRVSPHSEECALRASLDDALHRREKHEATHGTFTDPVIAGLDPAIHPSWRKLLLRRSMDARVKPGHDECDCVAFFIREHGFTVSPHVLREVDPELPALSYQRAQGMPGARCARSLACKSESSTHASRHGHTGITRHSPRNGLRLISRSPRGPGSFAPVVSQGLTPQTLAPASGRQDHTTLPSASNALVSRAISVHRNPPHVRDDRETPLLVRRDNSLYPCLTESSS